MSERMPSTRDDWIEDAASLETRLGKERAVRRQLAEAAHRCIETDWVDDTWYDRFIAALAASDALDREQA